MDCSLLHLLISKLLRIRLHLKCWSCFWTDRSILITKYASIPCLCCPGSAFYNVCMWELWHKWQRKRLSVDNPSWGTWKLKLWFRYQRTRVSQVKLNLMRFIFLFDIINCHFSSRVILQVLSEIERKPTVSHLYL